MKICYGITFKILVLLLFIFTNSAIADDSSHDAYFNAVSQIQKIPDKATAISPLSISEIKKIIPLLKNQYPININDNNAYDGNGNPVLIYQGDFSNDGSMEYAIVNTQGTINLNTVSVYKDIGNKLIDVRLDEVITQQLFPHGDMSDFYFNVAQPFAMLIDGKTYLRYMSYSGNYQSSDLILCTYLWQGKNFTLSGPNLKINPKSGKTIKADNCMSY